MTAQLCPQIPAQFTSAQDRKIFFGDDDNILKRVSPTTS